MTYFGCQQARMYLVSDLFGFCCLTGMSFLIKKEILDDAGGLEAYSKYIGEDFFIAHTGEIRGKRDYFGKCGGGVKRKNKAVYSA